MGVRREATIIRSTTSRRSGTSTQALLIQRFEATRGTGHGAGSRPQYNGGSTGRHGSKATHALSSQQAVKPTKPPPVQSTGGSLARRRPARPNHACHTSSNKATDATIFQRQLYRDIGATLSDGLIMHETGYFPVSRAAFGCWVRISRETYTMDRASDDVAPGEQRFPKATLKGQCCDCLPSVGTCT